MSTARLFLVSVGLLCLTLSARAAPPVLLSRSFLKDTCAHLAEDGWIAESVVLLEKLDARFKHCKGCRKFVRKFYFACRLQANKLADERYPTKVKQLEPSVEMLRELTYLVHQVNEVPESELQAFVAFVGAGLAHKESEYRSYFGVLDQIVVPAFLKRRESAK